MADKAPTKLERLQAMERQNLPDKNLRRDGVEIVFCHYEQAYMFPGGQFTKDRQLASECLQRLAASVKTSRVKWWA